MLDLFQGIHPLIVFDAVGFHFRYELVLHLVHLFAENLCRVLDDCLRQRNDIQGIDRICGIELRDGLDQVGGQCLVEGEIILEFDIQCHFGRAGALIFREDT